MASRLSSIQAQFRQRQLDEKEQKLLQLRPTTASSSSSFILRQRQQQPNRANSGLASSAYPQTRTSAAPVGRRPGVAPPSAAPATRRPAATVPSPSLYSTTAQPPAARTTTQRSAPSPLVKRNEVPAAPRRAAAPPLLDRSATYSKPTPTAVVRREGVGSGVVRSRGELLQLLRRNRTDENGNELSGRGAAAAGGVVAPKSAPPYKAKPPPPSSADIVRGVKQMSLKSAAPTRPSMSKVGKGMSGKGGGGGPPPAGSAACSQCGRHFLNDRVEKHESICKKTATKKRKVFDPTRMRMKGTEAEPYLRVVVSSKNKPGQVGSGGAAGKSGSTTSSTSNWRKKHEEFIRTIRLAKEYNAHVAAGGNPKDLPPPPPSDYSDYLQCPHCKRKFSEAAAERHIPKCAQIKSNKR